MKKVALGVALGMALVFGAFGQIWGSQPDEHFGQENLVLIWLNSLELAKVQMEGLLALVEELLPLREEIVGIPEKLHEELLAFKGTAGELRELLASYRTELDKKLKELEERFTKGLKNILTVTQWERLRRGLFRKEEAGWPRTGERERLRAMPRVQPPRNIEVYPVPTGFMRGLTLVRLLPVLKNVLTAKLEALGG